MAASVELTGPWQPGHFGWSAPARLRQLTQSQPEGEDLATTVPRRLILHLPDLDSPPPVEGRLHVRGMLRRSQPPRNGVELPPGPWRLQVKSRRLVTVEEGPGVLLSVSESLRSRVTDAWQTALTHGSPSAQNSSHGLALTRALILGDTTQLPPSWRRVLRRTGLAHLTAVSGLHVGLLMILTLAAGAWLPRLPQLLLCLPPLTLYLLLVGPRPSLLRAASMGLLAVAALLLKRPPGAAQALSLFVLAVVLIHPALVLDLGFRLSVFATAGLVILAPLYARAWISESAAGEGDSLHPRWGRPLAAAILTPIATWPVALPAFHLLPIAAPILNLAFVPWTGVCLVAGLLWTGLALLSPTLAALTLPILDLLTLPFAFLTRVPVTGFDALPLVAGPLTASLYTVVALLIARFPRRSAPAVLGLVLLCLQPQASALDSQRPLELIFLDVGQGDAILLRDGDRTMLIDGGGSFSADFGGRVLLPALAARGLRRLDTLVLTHPDRDHCGGLIDIADYLPVRRVASAPRHLPSSCLQRLLFVPAALGGSPSQRLAFKPLFPDTELNVGRFRLWVLHPPVTTNIPRDNNASVVLLVTVNLGDADQPTFLLTGDVEATAEAHLLRRYPHLQANILHIPHHGSKTSTTPGLLNTLQPRWALLSAGPSNPYGHPHHQTLRRLKEREIPLLRTDRDGAITFQLGKRGTWIEVGSPLPRGGE
ncbi:MAG: DNA internalization-related competence protein ComEC/Rec2 [Acidobacteriota bacterium]